MSEQQGRAQWEAAEQRRKRRHEDDGMRAVAGIVNGFLIAVPCYVVAGLIVWLISR